jgi:acyl-CoA reductase-like NAD-dependent aldehyde dehydrogenase
MATLSTVRIRRHRLLVGGEWSDTASGETVAIHRPATGEPVAQSRSVAYDVAGGTT